MRLKIITALERKVLLTAAFKERNRRHLINRVRSI